MGQHTLMKLGMLCMALYLHVVTHVQGKADPTEPSKLNLAPEPDRAPAAGGAGGPRAEERQGDETPDDDEAGGRNRRRLLQSDYITYYPSGVQTNVPESTLIAGGWTLCYDQNYAHPVTTAEVQGCGLRTHVLVGAKASAGAATLLLLAAGLSGNALRPTSSTSVAYLENGAYWYHMEGRSVGFAESSVIKLDHADAEARYASCAERLSWHLQGSGGFRAGCSLPLMDDLVHRKVMYTGGPLPPPPPPLAPPGVPCCSELVNNALWCRIKTHIKLNTNAPNDFCFYKC